MKGFAGITLFVVCASHVLAQNARQSALTFEVASVKPVAEPTGGGGGWLPGRFAMSYATLQTLVRMAYAVPDHRLVNAGASWIESDLFSVDARAPQVDGKPATPAQVTQMLQALLAERFKLVIRKETRELPTYTLVFARADRKLGSQLRASQVDCSTADGRRRAVAVTAPGRTPCYTTMGPTSTGLISHTGEDTQFAMLPALAASVLRREVQDATGLSGLFDWEIQWAPRPEIDGPAFATAVEEQLGLKLEPGRGPVEMLIIESAEHPSPN